MKYQAPTQGPYESGLTARLMCGTMKELLAPVTAAEIRTAYAKYTNRPTEKRWEVPKVRSQLEEFICSYFLTELREPLSGFKELVARNNGDLEENLASYLNSLKSHYSSNEKAVGAFGELIEKLKLRYDHMASEIRTIVSLEGNDILKRNTSDAFAHLMVYYYLITLKMRRVLKRAQS